MIRPRLSGWWIGMMLLLAAGPGPVVAEDWPTHRCDIARSGVTTEELAFPLQRQWVFRSPSPPAAGWGRVEPGEVWSYGVERQPKADYDAAFGVAMAGGRVFFASSAENKVYCLSAVTGKEIWSFHTAAPPRLAPTVAGGKIYFGADDGRAYCLQADTGKPVWTFRAAPGRDRAVGQGRVMSLWPVRTGVLVDGGVAYFGAGLFPAEGLCLYAVAAEDGKLIWRNNRFDQAGRGNITPQGHLLATADKLVAPSGRVAPAVFGRGDGELLFQVPGGRALTGGTYAVLAGERLYNGSGVLSAHELSGTKKDKYGRAVHAAAEFGLFRVRRIVVHKPTVYLATDEGHLALPESALPATARQMELARNAYWENRNQVAAYRKLQNELAALDHQSPRVARLQAEIAKAQPGFDAWERARQSLDKHLSAVCVWRLSERAEEELILAGGTLVAGGQGRVIAVDAATGRKRWEAKVGGAARILAVAGGRLLASTTAGEIHCFAAGRKEGVPPEGEANKRPPPTGGQQAISALGRRVLAEAGDQRGYCLLVGGSVDLALELARRTALRVAMTLAEADAVARARQVIGQAGLYGSRITVERGGLATLRYPRYFANLVVCANSANASASEVLRVLKPCGGVAFLGRPGKAPPDWPADLKGAGVKVVRRDQWLRIERGPLPGAKDWTHQYGEAGNTACSLDQAARPPFGILWFGPPGPAEMVDRHSRGSAPLVVAGRMFVQGRGVVMAHDAYNGTELWRREIPAAPREHVALDCSNLAATTDALLLAVEDRCLNLDPATGRTRATYRVPPAATGRRRWGWLAAAGETVFGSRTESDRPLRSWPDVSGNTSDCVFAVDTASGRARWQYEGKGILHPSIAVGGGAVFLIDRALTDAQRARGIRERIKDPDGRDDPPRDERGQPRPPDVRLVVALDAVTGRPRWTRPLDLTDCVVWPKGRRIAGGQVSLIYARGVLLLCSAPWNGHFMAEWKAGRFSRRSLIALDAKTGKVLWSGRKGYRSRPIVWGETIIAEPWAHDLRTGETVIVPNPLTGVDEKWAMWRGYGGCGPLVAGGGALWFRAGSIGYWDLARNDGITALGAQRPGCWINCIPACGMVLIPEGSAYCDCPYAVQCTVALCPKPEARAWPEYPLAKPLTPVRHIALNLGAPGDRRDERGVLWLHCPNRVRKHGWVSLQLSKSVGAGLFCAGARPGPAAGSSPVWVASCGARGLGQLAVPLQDKGSPPATYTVRLHFAEPDGLGAGERAFSVALQGKVMLKDFDVARAAAAAGGVTVKEFPGVVVKDVLRVDFSPAKGSPNPLPILSGLEAIRQDLPAGRHDE